MRSFGDTDNTPDEDIELSYDDPPEGTEIKDVTRFAPKPKLYRLADTSIAILGRLGKVRPTPSGGTTPRSARP